MSGLGFHLGMLLHSAQSEQDGMEGHTLIKSVILVSRYLEITPPEKRHNGFNLVTFIHFIWGDPVCLLMQHSVLLIMSVSKKRQKGRPRRLM